MAISLPLGSGNTGTNNWSDVYNNDAQLVTEFDARDDNYQTILTGSGYSHTALVPGTYAVVPSVAVPPASGASSTAWTTCPMLYFAAADFATASKTQKLRLRAQVLTNATAPAITLTFGLYPITVAGGAGTMAVTFGTVVSGSTVAHASPSASSITQGNSGDFTIPADGQYMVGVVYSGTLVTNALLSQTFQLQTRWV